MLKLLDPLLSPLARLLIEQGLLFPELSDRMKLHYVAAATRKLKADGGKLTDSRISTMTGLQRRDVARLRGGAEKPRPNFNYLARLVAEWQTNPDYAGRPLSRTGDVSFESLARDVHQDVHPRTILDALLASGTLSYDHETDTVELRETSYQPLAGSEDQIDYLARNTGDHLSAAVENVALGTRHFERAAHYSELTEDQISALSQDFREGQMDLLRRISQKAADMKRTKSGSFRFRAGAYFYTTGDRPK